MRNIDITTTQNVTISYQLATATERFFSFIIDCFVVGLLNLALVFLMSTFHFLNNESKFSEILLAFIIFLSFIIYQFVCESIMNGQSLGKKAVGLKVIRLDGQELGFSDYLLRAVFYLLDFYFSMGALGGLLISSTEKSQRLGDLAANTSVIKLNPDKRFYLDDILKINSIDNYEPKYPQVKHLQEKDVLLIKNVIHRWEKYQNQAHWEAVCDACLQVEKSLGLPSSNDKIQFLKTLIRDYIVLTR